MKTIAFSNMKGGVGKSSLSAALAAELAQAGDTLLIDCDPQASVSGWLAPDSIDAELADVLFEKKDIKQAITKTRCPGYSSFPVLVWAENLKCSPRIRLPRSTTA
jgi:chromosome partitioning protein